MKQILSRRMSRESFRMVNVVAMIGHQIAQCSSPVGTLALYPGKVRSSARAGSDWDAPDRDEARRIAGGGISI